MADAHEPRWYNVQEEAANKLDAIQGHSLLPVPVRVVLPVKMDLAILDADQAVIGDGHPVSFKRTYSSLLGTKPPVNKDGGVGGIYPLPLFQIETDIEFKSDRDFDPCCCMTEQFVRRKTSYLTNAQEQSLLTSKPPVLVANPTSWERDDFERDASLISKCCFVPKVKYIDPVAVWATEDRFHKGDKIKDEFTSKFDITDVCNGYIEVCEAGPTKITTSGTFPDFKFDPKLPYKEKCD